MGGGNDRPPNQSGSRYEKFSEKIVKEIAPASRFYRAEDYHQQYLEKLGQGSCGLPLREEHVPRPAP
jgi:peptide methionine sulfoxide reductase MsrA